MARPPAPFARAARRGSARRAGPVVRLLLLLVVLLHGELPVLKAAAGACGRGAPTAGAVVEGAGAVTDGAMPGSVESGGDRSEVPPAAEPGSCTGSHAVAASGDTPAIAAAGSAAPPATGARRPPSHRDPPPSQPPRQS